MSALPLAFVEDPLSLKGLLDFTLECVNADDFGTAHHVLKIMASYYPEAADEAHREIAAGLLLQAVLNEMFREGRTQP